MARQLMPFAIGGIGQAGADVVQRHPSGFRLSPE
jgi:hypothetical protein